MELKALPENGENLLAERMHFWDTMVWANREEVIERKMMYLQATQYLLQNNS